MKKVENKRKFSTSKEIFFFHEMNEVHFKRWSRRLTNLANFVEIKKSSMNFSQTVVSLQKLWFRVWSIKNEIKVAFAIFSAGEFKKISLKMFELEMRKISEIFSNSFDQKSQKNGIWFFKEHIKNMWNLYYEIIIIIGYNKYICWVFLSENFQR